MAAYDRKRVSAFNGEVRLIHEELRSSSVP